MSEILDWLEAPEQGFTEVAPLEFYRDIFPEGELDEKGAMTKGKYVGIIVEITKEKKKKVRKDGTAKEVPVCRRYSVTDDLEAVSEVVKGDSFCVMPPLSYAGKERTAENAREMYAMVFDLDGIIIKDGFARGLHDFWYGHVVAARRLPMPTYIVASGSGVHLYYVLERPVPLFKNVARQLQKYKREMTEMIWNEGITTLGEDRKNIQQEGIYQAFRMPGTVTKQGERVKAYRVGPKVTIGYLNEFVFDEYKVKEFSYKSELSKAMAKEKYPEWFERRIVQGQGKKKWAVSRKVYEWWKKEIFSKARVGHRYYCLMMLAIYAKKCSVYDEKHNPDPVTREELEEDAFELMERFDELTTDPQNRFDETDVQDALEAFEEQYMTYPRNSVAYRAGIEIQANKRNGRDQETHLKIARGTKKAMKEAGVMKQEGRPSKEKAVREYFKSNPKASSAEAARDLQMSKKTIYKYRKMIEAEGASWRPPIADVEYYDSESDRERVDRLVELEQRLRKYYDGYYGEKG